MSQENGTNLKQVLIELLGQKNRLTVHKSLAIFSGSIDRGIVLDQIIFWSEKSTESKDGWFHKSYKEWQEETTIKERSLNRIFKEFENLNLIERKTRSSRGIRKLYIKPLMSNIIDQFMFFLNQTDKVSDWRKNYTKTCTTIEPNRQSVGLQTDKVSVSYKEQNPLTQLLFNNTDKNPLDLGNNDCSVVPEEIRVEDCEKGENPMYLETYYPMPESSDCDPWFAVFWSTYPLKKNQISARKAWDAKKRQLEKHNRPFNPRQIIEKLKRQIAEDSQFLDGYMSTPTKYISDELWNDEIYKRPEKKRFMQPLDHNDNSWAKNIEKDLL